MSPLRPEEEPTPLGTDQGQVDVGSIPLPPTPPTPPMPGRAMPLLTPGRGSPREGETDPPKDLGHTPPGEPKGGNGDDSPSSNGDGENSGDGESSGGENNSEGNDNGHNNQSRDGNGDDGDEESQHSGLGACSTPSSQKADASTEDQMSQAEEPPGRWGPHPPNHLPRVQTRERGRSPAVSSLDSSRLEHNIPVLP